jgi:hypothetical protein
MTIESDGMTIPKWAIADPQKQNNSAGTTRAKTAFFTFSSFVEKKSHEGLPPSWRACLRGLVFG